MTVNQLESWVSLQIGLPRKTVLTRTALRRWQRDRLHETITLARRASPWYREHLRGSDPQPDEPVEAIIQSLPLMDAAAIREHGPEMICCSQSEIQRVVTLQSSGTSAAPKRLFFTAGDLEKTSGFFQHGMRLLASPPETVLILLPSQRPNDVGNLLVSALHEAGFSARTLWPAHDPELVASAVDGLKAGCLVGMPQHLLPLARRKDLAETVQPFVSSVLVCSDFAAPCVREAIADGLGCRVHQHYGSTESGLGGAVECSHAGGCHIRENDLLFEIIDPDTGQVLPDGSDGELVLSTLTRTGMPLLRYRTGDLARLTRRRCQCGSVLARLQNLQGRKDNCLRLPGGRMLTLAEMDQALLSLPEVLAYDAVLQEPDPEAQDIDSTGERPGRLAISLTGLPDAQARLRSAAAAALQTIPAIHRAVQGGGLSLDMAISESNPNRSHTVKRTLRDERSRPVNKGG